MGVRVPITVYIDVDDAVKDKDLSSTMRKEAKTAINTTLTALRDCDDAKWDEIADKLVENVRSKRGK